MNIHPLLRRHPITQFLIDVGAGLAWIALALIIPAAAGLSALGLIFR